LQCISNIHLILYQSIGAKPTSQGLINVDTTKVVFLNSKHLLMEEQYWKFLVSTIVDFNLPIEFQCDIINENGLDLIAMRLWSISRYIWRIRFWDFSFGKKCISKTLEMNPSIWKNVFCIFHDRSRFFF
jgi:hypothetical protein